MPELEGFVVIAGAHRHAAKARRVPTSMIHGDFRPPFTVSSAEILGDGFPFEETGGAHDSLDDRCCQVQPLVEVGTA